MTALLLACVLAAAGQGRETTHVLIVTGVGGEPAFSRAFVAQARELVTGLEQRWGVPAEHITWLGEQPESDPRMAGRSTREQVEQELVRLAAAARPEDRALLVLIGHGSDQGEPRFNLPGPDLGVDDYARLLDRLPARAVAVVVAASASGGFVDRLASPRRLVMTATRSGFERNETRFGAWFARAFGGEAADTDKDGRLSLYEAFAFASAEVRREYESANRLLTEHARLSDSTLAARFVFTPAGAAVVAAPGDTAMARLLARRTELERQIDELRGRRGAMDPAAYERALEELVLELARLNQAIRARGGTP
jgi:hypothetical protein